MLIREIRTVPGGTKSGSTLIERSPQLADGRKYRQNVASVPVSGAA
jgi:hypothetical protein